jgi:hypothetical protein
VLIRPRAKTISKLWLRSALVAWLSKRQNSEFGGRQGKPTARQLRYEKISWRLRSWPPGDGCPTPVGTRLAHMDISKNRWQLGLIADSVWSGTRGIGDGGTAGFLRR